MGFFTSQSTVSSSLEITPSTVSTLYTLTQNTSLSASGTMTAGMFWVFTNQTNTTTTLTCSSMTINGSGSYVLSVGAVITLVYLSGTNYVTTTLYGGLSGTPSGSIGGGGGGGGDE
jgi:hypothetical protein